MVTGYRWFQGVTRRLFLLALLGALGGCATGINAPPASPDQDGIQALRSHEGMFRLGPITTTLPASSTSGQVLLAELAQRLSVTLANFD